MGAPKAKKRKQHSNDPADDNVVDTSKPTAIFTPTEGRRYTVSVALPGSIISNAQSHDLKTALVGQIARALAVFCVDEIVIFDDGQSKSHRHYRENQNRNVYETNGSASQPHEEHGQDRAYTGYSDPDGFLIHILSYLETPPHLRKHLFPMHPNLRTAGTLPSLDMPHHLRANEWCQYREGVTVETNPSSNGTSAPHRHEKLKARPAPTVSTVQTLVETGLPHQTFVDLPSTVPPNTRVTLKYPTSTAPALHNPAAPLTATAISPDVPRLEAGYNWGFAIRRAASLSSVFTECPYDGGYDVSIGTSERGVPLAKLLHPSPTVSHPASPMPNFDHLLVAFGGVAGLEVAVRADGELVDRGVNGAQELFDYWVNVFPDGRQGSRTVRTEEAVWVGLMGLREFVVENGRKSWASDK